jgi:formamidopyrimidine-DNA glycosylase
MPELPEVETVRRGLWAELEGRRLMSASATGARSVRRYPDPASFGSSLRPAGLVGARRRGKYLGLLLEDGTAVVVHLGMSGQLLLVPAEAQRPKHTHVVMSFEGGADLLFVDPRTFGEVFITRVGEGGWPPEELAHLGFDPIEDEVGPARFAKLLASKRTQLKALLLDQRFVAGIGNIYSDEILFAARLRYDRAASSLSGAEARRLHKAVMSILTTAVELRGSSLVDQQYRDVYGQVGEFQLRHRVYAREGRSCERCKDTIVRVRAAGRSSFFCPSCQA